MSEAPTPQPDGRTAIIATVKTPLGFFALVVLVVEGLLGVMAGITTESERMPIVVAMIVVILALVGLVAFFAYFRPEALFGQRVTPPRPAPVSAPEVPLVANDGRVLCAATADFVELGFEHDVTAMKEAFKRRVDRVEGLSKDKLRELLTASRYTIVHLLLFVDPVTGELRFDDGETLSAEGFGKLVEVCGARLVVLATCDSLTLAAKISRQTNMIAASTAISVDDFAGWARGFYQMMGKGHSLSESFELATSTSGAPMILLMRRDLRLQ